MQYLYHIAHEGLDGEILYPLNQLKDIRPGAYAVHMRKYTGKEYLHKEPIKPLKCLWNDVLHLTAVHPDKINQALADANAPIIETGFYKVKPSLLDAERASIFLYMINEYNRPIYQEFRRFEPRKLKEYTEIPEQTKDYYKRSIEQNKLPVIFHGIPHILYKGTLDTNNLTIVK